jgi:amidase
LNPAINAIVTPDYDTARRRAHATDAMRARGEDGALLGLPLTIKDCIDMAGLPGTAGVQDFANRIPECDAPVVARVRAAGGVIIGKTNVPPMAGDWQADNPIFGRTNNPWNPDRTPGGSTGGGSAALAAGLTPLELGSDIGGSIRVPAAFCGVFGHRPSETAVPRTGHFPGGDTPNAAAVMGVQGPLARAAEDLELALDVIAGAEAGEDVGWRLTIPPARAESLSGLRVAVLPPISWLPVDDEIAGAQERLAGDLSRSGATVRSTQPDGFGDWREYVKLYARILMVMTSVGMPPDVRQAEIARLRSYHDELEDAVADGLAAGATDYLSWHGQREDYRSAYREFFRDWDLLLAPITLVPAFPHTAAPMGERTVEVNGEAVRYFRQVVPPALSTLAGQPATAFPVGLHSTGLPIGLQAIGPYLEDRTPIRFAELVTREFGGFQAPPGYA